MGVGHLITGLINVNLLTHGLVTWQLWQLISYQFRQCPRSRSAYLAGQSL